MYDLLVEPAEVVFFWSFNRWCSNWIILNYCLLQAYLLNIKMTYISDPYQWPMSVTYISDIYQWSISVTHISDPYQWPISVAYISDLYQWPIYVTHISDLYQWPISVTYICDLQQSLWLYETSARIKSYIYLQLANSSFLLQILLRSFK